MCVFSPSHGQSAEQMKPVWHERYMTTKASLRTICLNDLYRPENLRELAAEGDIHGALSLLQMSVP